MTPSTFILAPTFPIRLHRSKNALSPRRPPVKMASEANPHAPKRLCAFSDGSWFTPEMETLSNVAQFARAVEYEDETGMAQLVFYDPGVGTEGGFVDRLRGGAFGAGIDLNIQQLYTFLALNYCEGDEIYLFGFSRGAYTVRSLAGMMHESGLVYRDHLDQVKEAYDLYRENIDAESDRAKAFRAEFGRRVPIKLLTCFDTVGALGLPKTVPFGNNKKYQFHDTTLNPFIEHAIHVVSTDEDTEGFLPTLMTPNKARGMTQLTQLYFPGYHGGVGGGSKEEEPLARNALKFVVEEMKGRGLSLHLKHELIPSTTDVAIEPSAPKSWFSIGSFLKFVSGKKARVIGRFEELHDSVLERYKLVEKWRPKSLEPFKERLRKS